MPSPPTSSTPRSGARPAAYVSGSSTCVDGQVVVLAEAATDDDGRVRDLGPDRARAGHLPDRSSTSRRYAAATGQSCFFPEVALTFALTDANSTTTSHFFSARSPTPPTEGADPMAIRAGPEPVRQGREPRRPDLPRHRSATRSATSTSRPPLRGGFEDAHTSGDQGDVVPTDTQKNTVFAFAKEKGVDSIEDVRAARSADHFIGGTSAADGARSRSRSTPGTRIPVDGAGHDHSFVRPAAAPRTTVVNVDGRGATGSRTSCPGSRTWSC